MKVLFCTPAFGGQMTTETFSSYIKSTFWLNFNKIDFAVMTLSNESLINRGRNQCANAAMELGYDCLFFIDADVGWELEDLEKILLSKKQIVGGTYSLKTLPISLNFNSLPEHFSYFTHRKTIENLNEYKKLADEYGEIEVMHIPTGFLKIDTSVLKDLSQYVKTYNSTDIRTGETKKYYDFFPIQIKNGVMESEDWGFSSIAKDHGHKIYFNTNVICTHTGSYTFKP